MQTLRKHAALLALLAIVALAAGLRLYLIDAQSLWYDEGASLRFAERSLSEIWVTTDIHPPGYYALLSGWTGVFGRSEAALRGLSALCGVLLIGVVYRLGQRLFDTHTGLLAALLVAIDPFHVYYGQETRMYALLALLGGLALWLFVRWLDAQTRQPDNFHWPVLAGLALTNAAGLYTHYFYPIFLIVQGLLFVAWWLWESPRPRRLKPLLVWAGAQVVTITLYVPWLPVALSAVFGSGAALTNYSAGEGLLAIASVLAYGQTLPPHATAAASGLVALGILLVVGLLPPIEIAPDDAPSQTSHRWRVSLLLAWAFIPVLLIVGYRLYQSGALGGGAIVGPNAGAGSFTADALRFLLPADVALALLLARGVRMGFELARAEPVPGAPRNAVWIGVVVVVLMGVGFAPVFPSLRNLYFDSAYARDDYRGLAAYVASVSGAKDAVILNGPGQLETFTYYAPPATRIYPLPSDQTEADLQAILSAPGRVFAVFYGENERDPQRSVENALDGQAFEAETRWFGNVRLVTYGVAPGLSNDPDQLSGAIFGEAIQLLGYSLDTSDVRPGGTLNVALFWQADAPVSESYSVFVHLIAETDQPLTQHDGAPGGGLLYTHTWTPGESVRDNHGLLLPPDLPPGDYRLVVGLFDPATGRLVVVPGEAGEVLPDNRLLLTSVEVSG